jgi:hypothetical protein
MVKNWKYKSKNEQNIVQIKLDEQKRKSLSYSTHNWIRLENNSSSEKCITCGMLFRTITENIFKQEYKPINGKWSEINSRTLSVCK